ncbi:RPAP1-like protein [Oesophagostomum dentatum]|uniref:RPAP1-like protein n=1 Tax=Oesophagostomum dentatum TaxID=61180 RepID=A0A0B1TMY7_OESDE|nr:RPAP1-like protein [Oesophagostomum dentatum]
MDDRSIFLKRPTANETEDDILAMQAEWEAKKSQQNKPAVQIHRMKGKSPPAPVAEEPKQAPKKPRKVQTLKSIPPRNFEQGGRFVIDLEKITEEWSNRVLFDVEERNADWLVSDHSDELARKGFEKLQYSADDGFPEVLDLSAYYKKDAEVKRSAGTKSFFAAEFDRLHGKIEEAVLIEDEQEPNTANEDNFEVENDKYLASLDQEKIKELRQEITEKINPATIAFLKNRHKNKPKEDSKPTVSKFKASRKTAQPTAPSSTVNEGESPKSIETNPPAPPPPPEVEDMLNQLEVLDEFADRSDQEKYNRLATDAVQLDFVTKCLRNVAPRQQKNAVKLFDNCKIAPSGSRDPILELARSRIDNIKELYLEEIKSGDETFFQFAHGVNPLVDGSWTLVPVRRVLDAVQKREDEVCEDDVDIVRLALLWTLLLHDERLTAFLAFADPNEIYVRLAEVLLVGRDVLADEVIAACYSRLLNGYVLKTAIEGRLCLHMDSHVAGLDAFMPFYEDLLVHFEEYSLGDVSFARTLLIGAYLNSALSDSLECRFAIWCPKKNTARQITLKMSDAEDIMPHIRRLSAEQASTIEEQHYVQYTSLLGTYAGSIRDEKVTRERNPLMFAIAAEELGNFMKRHTRQDPTVDPSKLKEFDMLVGIIRSTVKGVLDI